MNGNVAKFNIAYIIFKSYVYLRPSPTLREPFLTRSQMSQRNQDLVLTTLISLMVHRKMTGFDAALFPLWSGTMLLRPMRGNLMMVT